MAKHRVVIEIDEEAQAIKVTHDGAEVELESIAIFGGDARSQEVFIKMFGASADAAWAFAQGFRISRTLDGGKGLKNFYRQGAAHICQIIDPAAFKREIGSDELLNRWEDGDQRNWFAQDSEDVLEDKQISEGRKPSWN